MSEADQTVNIDAADSNQLQPSSSVGSSSSCLLPALVGTATLHRAKPFPSFFFFLNFNLITVFEF